MANLDWTPERGRELAKAADAFAVQCHSHAGVGKTWGRHKWAERSTAEVAARKLGVKIIREVSE